MILEGFEVENWACIRKLAVSGLPASGVVVLHGPNRTGKSSLVRALRACLMDYPSTTTALKGEYPRGTGEKPMVGVTFAAGGASYRIRKWFGSSKSELAVRTPTGDWRVEATAAAEAHARLCELAGGDDSARGLQQLLWLTQAEFRLPDAKKFDPNLQARLRGVLGVLQTPLDDRFIGKLRERWNVWHAGQRRPGKPAALKPTCPLARHQNKLEDDRAELEKQETRFQELEALLRQATELEERRADLDRQCRDQSAALQKCQEERERCQVRIEARKRAEEGHAAAAKEHRAALDEQQRRDAAARRLAEALEAMLPTRREVERLEPRAAAIEKTLAGRKAELARLRDRQRAWQQKVNRVAAKTQTLDDREKLAAARAALQDAQAVEHAISEIKTYLINNPIPDAKAFEALKADHQRILRLQADLDAASMTLRIAPEDGAAPARLVLDGVPASATPADHPVRRTAALVIPDWGRIELSRGAGGVDLDQIEAQLQQCRTAYADALTTLGIPAGAPDALDQVRARLAVDQVKRKELQVHEQAWKKAAPDALRKKVIELETKLNDPAALDPAPADLLPNGRDDLERLRTELNAAILDLAEQIAALDSELTREDAGLSQARDEAARAKQRLAAAEATADSRREELGRLPDEAQTLGRIDAAKTSLATAEQELERSKLTVEESSVDERLDSCKDAVRAVETQIRETEARYNTIKGRMEQSEGLHADRAALAARVDELTRRVERETLERDAVDRLYELFEECREKQLGTLMGPIQDRVLGWMRALDLGDYKEVRFNDAFLPDKLIRRDGTAELSLDEESTGAQEQVGLLVRIALGSLLTSSEPTSAILDDPLTHCDVGRLHRMRRLLRRAAEGDPDSNPPAGPLQILIFTCHPEWFRDEQATVVDLESPDVMLRYAV